MVAVITVAPHKYAEVKRAPGDKYQADERFLPSMEYMGWVKRDDGTTQHTTTALLSDSGSALMQKTKVKRLGSSRRGARRA